jgi:hypothetical protein
MRNAGDAEINHVNCCYHVRDASTSLGSQTEAVGGDFLIQSDARDPSITTAWDSGAVESCSVGPHFLR